MSRNRKLGLKPEFRRQFDLNYKGTKSVIEFEPSQTVPDQNLSVRQLLKNHSRGMGIGVPAKEGIYSEIEVPVFTDLTDVLAYNDDLLERQQALKDELTLVQEKRKLAEEEKARLKAEELEKDRKKKKDVEDSD